MPDGITHDTLLVSLVFFRLDKKQRGYEYFCTIKIIMKIIMILFNNSLDPTALSFTVQSAIVSVTLTSTFHSLPPPKCQFSKT
jgi:hypothetical protein